jgi:hypothetical protein
VTSVVIAVRSSGVRKLMADANVAEAAERTAPPMPSWQRPFAAGRQ